MSVLNELETTGALQARNRMDLDALLNPEDEAQDMEETTDEEICQAVLDAQKQRKRGN